MQIGTQTGIAVADDADADVGAAVERGPRVSETERVASVEGLVCTIARQHSWRYTPEDQEDVKAAGRVGALRAARKFDPTRGVKFSTYAVHWIRAYVIEQVIEIWGRGRVGDSNGIRNVFFNYGKAVRAVDEREVAEAVESVDFTRRERIAAELGISVDFLEAFGASIGAPDASLDEVVETYSGEGGCKLVDTIADDSVPDADALAEAVSEDAVRERIGAALGVLDDRRRYVVDQRFFRRKTLEEVGASLGLTKERVRQLEREALTRLRCLLRGLE